jgi:hypothetical protein
MVSHLVFHLLGLCGTVFRLTEGSELTVYKMRSAVKNMMTDGWQNLQYLSEFKIPEALRIGVLLQQADLNPMKNQAGHQCPDNGYRNPA